MEGMACMGRHGRRALMRDLVHLDGKVSLNNPSLYINDRHTIDKIPCQD